MFKEKVIIESELGLHARPAAKIAEIARRFKARVYLKKGSQTADAASILDVLALVCRKGSAVEIWAEGEEAEKAIKEITTLLRSNAL
ncbi:Phosphotransferase system, phosphocarrier protein HPr [Thermodesulfatator indicus DSM 15286]|uniref:Phosphotransferase system, phosphocarrier protein HPr n=1 Tax=Thermodesulfatator indicus (strain DSM 15286 / JCM 11887 / CIR29812) TaxID=667014 RepID=F8A847_THEID|nr:HPr family phosphocarrier protein [Thermodesulfatator indicus]AEH45042.1 Phosphotransferase system, phosphocarrier protein HPr [Thermodesulfatator indicus DSM 15286]